MKQVLNGLRALLGIGARKTGMASNRHPGRLRSMALALGPADIAFDPAETGTSVHGFLMDVGYPGGFHTLVVIADGTTGLCSSDGGGIPGGESERLQLAASNLLAGADYFLDSGSPVDDFPAPAEGEVVFYFLTGDGATAYRGNEASLEDDRDALSGLYFLAQKVIAELRRTGKVPGA